MTTATRSPKQALATNGDLDRHWAQTARTIGRDSVRVDRLRAERTPPAAADDRVLLARLTEFDATFSETEARAVALEASAGVPVRGALRRLAQLRHDGEVIGLRDGRETTWTHRAIERETVAAAERLAAGRVTAIDGELVVRETARLDGELRRQGGGLAGEQREALALACSDRQLVLIEGRAGTGKSTVPSGVARSHQAAGRQIITTSTAALAAHRLAADLHHAGVDARAYSTAGLHAAVASGHLELGTDVTVIHDEAALASTREQNQLMAAVESSGARLIEVGDPRQSHPVGASGLWARLEHTAVANQAHCELTRNQRALDPEDRTSQDLFRTDQIELALARYEDRGRVRTAGEPRIVEDRALEAAHADRQAGKRTLVIAQTSNEQLDALNARAQAIRQQDSQLGQESIAVSGRPYGLRAGDEIQVRRNLTHPKHGRIANGTNGTITAINPETPGAIIELSDGRHVALAQDELDRGEVRLAYVQHPFPAQGQTTDTAHLIIGPQATREGSYVGLTRARERTHIYAQTPPDANEPAERLRVLAERMSQTEPEIASIDTPISHEEAIARATHAARLASTDRPVENEPDPRNDRGPGGAPAWVIAALEPRPEDRASGYAAWNDGAAAITGYRQHYAIDDDEQRPLGPEPPAGSFQQRHDRNQAAQRVADARRQLRRPANEIAMSDARDADGNDRSAENAVLSRGKAIEP
jgi:hypothetical protein